MIRFYAPDIERTLTLPEGDSQHCVRVLRSCPGDMLAVVDGFGNEFVCRLLDANPRQAHVEIVEKHKENLPWSNRITVAVAPTKMMDRMEWMVEKLTEIGVDRIVPIVCEHSERKEIKRERLEKIAVSAMKQSLKATLPKISEIMKFKEFVREESENSSLRFFGYCNKNFERKSLANTYVPMSNVTILIGPEGDFSLGEVNQLVDVGFVPVTMGDCRLRTETAAIVACETIHIINSIRK